VRELVSQEQNADIRELFMELRREINSVSNAAYVEAMIAALLGHMSALDWVSLFPKVYDTARGQDMSEPRDTNVAPIWRQYIVSQYTDCYYTDVLAMQREINAEMLLA